MKKKGLMKKALCIVLGLVMVLAMSIASVSAAAMQVTAIKATFAPVVGTEYKNQNGIKNAFTELFPGTASVSKIAINGNELGGQNKYTFKYDTAAAVTATVALTGNNEFSDLALSANVNDGKITATLTKTKAKEATLAFSYTPKRKSIADCTVEPATASFTFDGKVKNAFTKVKDGKKELAKGADKDYVVTGDFSATNAGQYTATIEGKGDYEGTKTVNWSIGRAEPEVGHFDVTIPKADALIYDSQAKEVVAAAKETVIGMGAVTVDYYKGATKLDSAPTEVGDYTFKLNVAGDGQNYSAKVLEKKEWKFSITKKQLTISGTTVVKTYDGTTTASVTVGQLSGVAKGDDVSASATGTFKNKNVGTGKDVSVTYTLKGEDAGNYIAPVKETVKGKIVKAELTVDGTVIEEKTYDGGTEAVAIVGEPMGLVAGDDVVVSVSAAFKDKKAGTDKDVIVTYTYSGDDVDNYTAPAKETLKGTINKAPLTVDGSVAESKTYDGKSEAVVIIGELEGYVAGDDVVADVTGTFENILAGEKKNVEVVYTISGDDSANYETPKKETLNADITKITKDLNIFAKDIKKVYDGTPLTGNGVTYTDNVLIEGDEIEAKLLGSITAVGKGNVIIASYKIMNGDIDVTSCYEAAVLYDGELVITANPNSEKQVDAKALALIYENYKGYGGAGRTSVELKLDDEVAQEDKDMIIAKAGKKKLIFTDAMLILTYDGKEKLEEENIGNENTVPVGITYKFNFENKKDIQIFKVHTDEEGLKTLTELTTEENEDGDYVVFDKQNGEIKVVATKYSTFAIAYNEEEKKGVSTGDTNELVLFSILAILSLAGAGYGLKRREH